MPYSGWMTQVSPGHEECHEGVPVDPPLWDRSPGGSYGMPSQGLLPCSAMFPSDVPLAETFYVEVPGGWDVEQLV